MSGSERYLTPSVLRPSALNGSVGSPRVDYRFTPIASVPPPPPTQFIPQTVRPVPTTSGTANVGVRTTVDGSNGLPLDTSTSRPYKRKPFMSAAPSSSSVSVNSPSGPQQTASAFESTLEPQRKLHLSDDFVAQTMSELYISPPTSKVAKRELNRDVAEAINLEALEDLQSKFSNQAINDEVILPQRTRRCRKVPVRQRQPQLRLTLHQDLKNVKSGNGLPESLISRYRPNSRSGGSSTALVVWKPPGGFLPDLINNALLGCSGRGSTRQRCYSEVTSTPYSSHENLVCPETEDMKMYFRGDEHRKVASPSPMAAEAPELSSTPQSEEEILPSVGLQRRNSAPEISEPLQFMDDERCMEL
eukprot:TRINITY_DN3042_c0_g1_i1.p1 TRINITY_DN3042_c0_g1~~TRINITY_DN3042_c0_g1_i1.p1  ORF type:complete len:360 (+),score=86.28 TRINITY_DN3042_c0_g1_i1:60-1139(+)